MGGDERERRAVADFLDSSATHPSALIIEGEAGIGKTTLWMSALDQALARTFRVLSARVGRAESGLAFAVLADLLTQVQDHELEDLPHLQRVALGRVLLHEADTGPATNERVVAAAFLTLVDRLSTDTPVVLAIDDAQWLDSSSRTVVAFAARRLKGRVGILVTERTDAHQHDGGSWLEVTRLDGLQRIRVNPLSLGGLRMMLATHLGRALPRPAVVRIGELSGGNPFYALELARTMDESTSPDPALGVVLSDLVRARLDRFGEDALTVLLAAACVGTPTVELLSDAVGETAERVVDILEVPESDGVIRIEGNRVLFTHPLLAHGVYTMASPASRRQMHRMLADVVRQPESRARHLALSTSHADPVTLEALDAAATAVSARGAPAAAAELLELAIDLGGDTPARRIQCAENHFRAGEPTRAETLLTPIVDQPEGAATGEALHLLAGIRLYGDSLSDAVDLLDRALTDGADDPVLVVRSLLLSSFALLYLGRLEDSIRRAAAALDRASVLCIPELISQVLAMLVLAKCMRGDGVDEPHLQRALELEQLDADVPIHYRASAVRMFTDAWTGELEAARRGAIAVRKLCRDRGAEREMLAVAVHRTLVEVWSGDFAAAELAAAEATELAERVDGRHLRGVALTSRAAAAAHLGRADEARADARAVLQIATDCGTPQLALRAMATLGFVEVSVADYEAALSILQPLIDSFEILPGVEIRNRDWAADAVEAMINVGQITEAEPLIDKMEADGRRLDRAWLLATGARCRAMWWLAQRDVDRAMDAVTSAMAEHDRLPMPFERARTQLLLGTLQRRRRLKQPAAQTLTEALGEFERMGASLWAERTRVELSQLTAHQDSTLTATERRIAELAMTGVTNREIASALFMSVKTVEWNLTQIYRKLAIRSRAQLAQSLRPSGP